jgi:hypothetical protein
MLLVDPLDVQCLRRCYKEAYKSELSISCTVS